MAQDLASYVQAMQGKPRSYRHVGGKYIAAADLLDHALVMSHKVLQIFLQVKALKIPHAPDDVLGFLEHVIASVRDADEATIEEYLEMVEALAQENVTIVQKAKEAKKDQAAAASKPPTGDYGLHLKSTKVLKDAMASGDPAAALKGLAAADGPNVSATVYKLWYARCQVPFEGKNPTSRVASAIEQLGISDQGRWAILLAACVASGLIDVGEEAKLRDTRPDGK